MAKQSTENARIPHEPDTFGCRLQKRLDVFSREGKFLMRRDPTPEKLTIEKNESTTRLHITHQPVKSIFAFALRGRPARFCASVRLQNNA